MSASSARAGARHNFVRICAVLAFIGLGTWLAQLPITGGLAITRASPAGQGLAALLRQAAIAGAVGGAASRAAVRAATKQCARQALRARLLVRTHNQTCYANRPLLFVLPSSEPTPPTAPPAAALPAAAPGRDASPAWVVLTNVDSYAAQYYLGHQLRTMRAIRSVGGGLLSSHYLVDCLDEQALALCRGLHSHPQLCLYNVRGSQGWVCV